MTYVFAGLTLVMACLLFGGVLRLLPPDPVGPYVPQHRAAGEELPERPPGKAALKAEIAKAPVNRLPVLAERPTGASGKRHDPEDWRFNTAEFQLAWDEWFADQPNNGAVAKPWAGTGVTA